MQNLARRESDEEAPKPKMRLQTWLMCVPHEDVERHVAAGWTESSALQDTHHGVHGRLMVWEHDGEPPNV